MCINKSACINKCTCVNSPENAFLKPILEWVHDVLQTRDPGKAPRGIVGYFKHRRLPEFTAVQYYFALLGKTIWFLLAVKLTGL